MRFLARFVVPFVAAISLLAVGPPAPTPPRKAVLQNIPLAPAFTPGELYAYAGADWITAAGGLTDDRYSTLSQITSSNVANLKLVWHTRLGFIPAKSEAAEGNAIVYKGVMYLVTGVGRVYALDAATGAIIWRFVPHPLPAESVSLLAANRGPALGDGKVYVGLLDGSVYALDQRTGAVVWRHEYGPGGAAKGYFSTAPTLYYNGMVIQVLSGGDWGRRGSALALDAKTGKELWRWYPVPSPGEPGSDTWPPGEWKKGGGGIWINPSVDPSLGLIYVVTGNPVPFNGRGPGQNLFANSIVALHANDGRMAWYYQMVHHDIWDYDVTNPPVIFDATINGRLRHGIATASKTGWVYILDRATGQPLLPIPERRVPQLNRKDKMRSYVNAWPTQPEPQGDAFVDQCAHRSDYERLAPDGKPYIIGCIFTPWPNQKSSFYARVPSYAVSWPPSAYNPNTHFEYLCATDGAGPSFGAIPKIKQKWIPGDSFAVVGATFGGGAKHQPVGNVSAIDVTTNKLAWQVKGPSQGWPTPCFSGILTTAGGIVVAGHTGDSNGGSLSAYDARTGTKVWDSEQLDGGANAPSVTYSVNGEQHISIFAGGGGSGGKPSDSVYTWTLP
jgi:quinohemoprotein ethanol dehydrogenase